MKYLAVKDFAKFQHYRDRNPPWIKLYGTLLSDAAFLQMPEVAQAQLVKLWVLASQLGHPLPNNPKLLAGRIGTTGKFHLRVLMDAGFIIPTEQNASTLLAEDYENDSPSVRARGRGESSEIELSVTAAEAEGEACLAVLLASDSDRVALTTVLAKAGSRSACLASLRSMLTGNDPATPQPTAEQFGQALRDYVANAQAWNAALFRGYVKRAGPRTEAVRPSGTTARQSPHDGAGRGALLFTEIRKMVREERPPGQPVHRFIRKTDVAKLGADVLLAYEAIGGSDRVLACTGETVSFAIRDFTAALQEAARDYTHV